MCPWFTLTSSRSCPSQYNCTLAEKWLHYMSLVRRLYPKRLTYSILGHPHRSNLGGSVLPRDTTTCWLLWGLNLWPSDSNTNAQPTAPHASLWSAVICISRAKFIGRVNSLSLMHSLRAQVSKAVVALYILSHGLRLLSWLITASESLHRLATMPMAICTEVLWACVALACEVSCRLTGCRCTAPDGSWLHKRMTVTTPILSAPPR